MAITHDGTLKQITIPTADASTDVNDFFNLTSNKIIVPGNPQVPSGRSDGQAKGFRIPMVSVPGTSATIKLELVIRKHQASSDAPLMRFEYQASTPATPLQLTNAGTGSGPYAAFGAWQIDGSSSSVLDLGFFIPDNYEAALGLTDAGGTSGNIVVYYATLFDI